MFGLLSVKSVTNSITIRKHFGPQKVCPLEINIIERAKIVPKELITLSLSSTESAGKKREAECSRPLKRKPDCSGITCSLSTIREMADRLIDGPSNDLK